MKVEIIIYHVVDKFKAVRGLKKRKKEKNRIEECTKTKQMQFQAQ